MIANCDTCGIEVMVPEGNCDLRPGGPFYCTPHFNDEAERRLALDPDNYFLQQAVARAG